MPSVVIEVRRSYSQVEEVALMDAVHGALVRAFRISPNDRHVRLLAHEPHRFTCPPGKAQPDRYTQVSIDAFAGRSIDAKRARYRDIVDSLEVLGIPRDHVPSSCATFPSRPGEFVAALLPATSSALPA